MEGEDYLLKLTFEDLRSHTDDFSHENYIGEFQFGKVYHGKIPQDGRPPKTVTVKIWEIPTDYRYYKNENVARLTDEVILLSQKRFCHPGLMKLYGYCSKTEQCGIVYDFKSFNTVANLIRNDDFNWLQRIKVALGIARLVKCLQHRGPLRMPLLIRNIHAAHIMVDEDWNPKLFDFSMVTGGIFPNRMLYRIQHIRGYDVYSEPDCFCWCPESDVYAIGVLFLCLMTKTSCTENGVHIDEWAYDEYAWGPIEEGIKNSKTSLVAKSFEAEKWFYASDGPKFTKLAMWCIAGYAHYRPKIKEVIKRLRKLQVVKNNPAVDVFYEN